MLKRLLPVILAIALLSAISPAALASESSDIISSSWKTIEPTGTTVVDTIDGVEARYSMEGGRGFSCRELVTRYYSEARNIRMFDGHDLPSSSEKGWYFKTLTPNDTPKPGDVVYWPVELRDKDYSHWALVKSYSNGVITLIEQNWKWENKAGFDRKIKYPGTSYYVYTAELDTPSGWAHNTVTEAEALSLINSSVYTRWQANVTRSDFCSLLSSFTSRLRLRSDYTPTPFTDVGYSSDISAIYSLGIINGRTDTLFAPNELITRDEMALMLHRFAEKLGADTYIPDAEEVLAGFTDAKSVNSWAREAMAYCIQKGYITGTGEGSLSPRSFTTKEQVVVMLMRIYNEHYAASQQSWPQQQDQPSWPDQSSWPSQPSDPNPSRHRWPGRR